MMERATGLEPADISLGSWGLTTWQLVIYEFRVQIVHEIKDFVYNLYAELKHEVNSSKLNSGRLI